MNIICTIKVVVMMGSVGFQTTAQVQGPVISGNGANYVANFEPYIRKNYPKVADAESYAKYLVSKNACGTLE